MKKAFDQTVRDLKRGVNKKVLKVPSIEQKVLDATSNEPWGPHGSLLAEIAMASRNHRDFYMIMTVIWKRVNDTGKNWRHVYKGLTVLEYLVANGSERVIDEIKEHAYQITTLSEFQYIDHNAKDQGSNVRKKSQSLVALVNDKEKIQEVRQKAAANWDKFHKTSGGGNYRPGSYPGPGGFDDDRFGNRDDYGSRERDFGEERYGRDRYRDDEYGGRRSVDGGDSYGRRSRSSDRDRERAYEDEGQYSSRGSYSKTDDQSSNDGRNLERKSSEQNLGVPPSYEDAVGGGRSPIYSERDGETKSPSPLPPLPPVTASRETTFSSSPEAPAVAPPPVAASPPPPPPAATPPPPVAASNNGFDEFDPRGSFPAAPPTSGSAEMDFFGDALALVPVTTSTSTDTSPPAQNFVAAPVSSNQQFEDPFGDGPFRAVSSTNGFTAPPQSAPVFGQSSEPPRSVAITSESGNNFGNGSSYDRNTDFLADLLPPAGPSQASFQPQPQPQPNQTQFQGQTSQPSFQGGQPGQPSFQGGQPSFQGGQPGQPSFQGGQPMPQGGQTMAAHGGYPSHNGQQPAHMNNFYGGFDPQGSSVPVSSTPVAPSNTSSFYQQPPALTGSTGALAIIPQEPSKFETKSTVWADTLNRGLVDLNIAGSKTNPLSDIGVDFEALNRKEKRMEKPSTTPMTSNVAMGKAMGSGSGIGRAGVGALRPQPNPMMGPGYGPGYGGVNRPMGQYQMQAPSGGGFPPGTYNPMMGRGGGGYGYGQQPYGGGYR